MKKTLPVILCLTVAILLGVTGCSGGDRSGSFQKGIDVHESGDHAAAIRELTPLAEQGDASAQFTLGVMYAKGHGVPRNIKTAVQWYTRAAEQGDSIAQFNLGLMYALGYGVPLDHKTAVKWYTRAAEQGHASAQHNLGVTYYYGESVPQDYVLARMWFNIAASSGNEDAIKGRNLIAKKMTEPQIKKAQGLARDFVPKAE